MARHNLCCSLVAGIMIVTSASASAAPASLDAWSRYRARFIATDGRVLDTGNGGISHSEGQGYAMLLAVHHGDRPTFLKLWGWTATHLRRRDDRLFAWKWTPAVGVVEKNNASDGDLLIAWALSRAATRWRTRALAQEARAIGQSMLANLFRAKGDLSYLLPGASGFENPHGDVINLSYCVFPALDELGSLTGRPEWRRVSASAVVLLKQARFGPWGLAPDWLMLSKPLKPAPGFPARCGFDAIRIPLYLMWGARPASLLRPFQTAWQEGRTTGPPAWFALDGKENASFALGQGGRAIAEAALVYPDLPQGPPAAFDERADYYDASLSLLVQAMCEERARP